MASERFARSQRLTHAADYTFVFDRACKSNDKYFTLLCRANGRDIARLGLAVAKKQIHRAVDRNRIKRLVRESFRQNQQALAGLDIVVMARHGVLELTNKEILSRLETHWQQLIKRCKNSFSS